MDEDYVEIIGTDGRPHRVPAARMDEFVDGRTGQLISDADYDESKRRTIAAETAEGYHG